MIKLMAGKSNYEGYHFIRNKVFVKISQILWFACKNIIVEMCSNPIYHS